MGEETGIAWTDHTWSPWRGCTKVSPGCTNCYAETLSHRNPGVLGVWGPNGTRVVAAESAWKLPLKWDRAAARDGVRRRVFFSLGDPFEDWPELAEPRRRLFHLTNQTPHLDWLLLTKRPGNIRRVCEAVPGSWSLATPPNVWLGVSVEDQARADERIPVLLSIPARVRFLSVEPLLGPVDLNAVRWQLPDSIGVVYGGVLENTDGRRFSPRGAKGQGIDWVIVGGESGPGRRPLDPAWVESIADQCEAAGVPLFVKQDSGPKPGLQGRLSDRLWALKQFPEPRGVA